jgi:acyl-CoA synthetase (AMP-forming)/AMP-acid ligase II
MDDKHHLLSRGEVGEIVIRGATVITAYTNRAALQEESFTDGWLRTGDQGYLDSDGYVFLTGRLKEIINRGGEKISPKEVEDILLGHTEISQAVVFRLPHPSLGDDVAAALVLRHGSQNESTVKVLLIGWRFKVPSRVVIGEVPGRDGRLPDRTVRAITGNMCHSVRLKRSGRKSGWDLPRCSRCR